MKSLFILTSAINSKFGVYNAEQRLQQTIDSIHSIKKHVPDAKIALIEMTGVSPTDAQVAAVKEHIDYFYDYTRDEAVQDIYNSTDNWDIVKNTTEVMVFANVLGEMIEAGIPDKFDRMFKMSGRYVLSDNFDPAVYESAGNNIVVLARKTSQFPAAVTGGMQFQYMSRLWSWPAEQAEAVLDSYNAGFVAMAECIARGGYFDIEHMLFAYLPKAIVTEVPRVGVRGLLGPNGIAIED